MRGQLEVRQFALQHATDARDAAIQRAEMAESRADNAEYKLDEESRNFSEQLAAQAAAARQREASLREEARCRLPGSLASGDEWDIKKGQSG